MGFVSYVSIHALNDFFSSYSGMLMVKVPHLVFGIWSLALVAISTSEAAALSALGEELLDASNEIEPNGDNRYF